MLKKFTILLHRKPRQRYRQLDCLLRAPDRQQQRSLSTWIDLIDIRKTDSVTLATSATKDDGTAWLHSLLELVDVLASVARVPLFAKVTVLRWQKAAFEPAAKSASFHATFNVPVVDEASLEDFDVLLAIAFRITSWIREHSTQSPQDPKMRDAFYNFVVSEMAAPSAGLPSRGKSTYHVLQACYDAAVPVCDVAGTVYQLGWGVKGQRIDRSLTDGDSLIGARLTHNKLLTAQLLYRAGLPTPHHTCVVEVDDAMAAAQAIGWPVVIKPADAERGEGVTVDVMPDQLETAFALALQNSPGRRVLVERQIAGTCHRLFIAQGRLLYAVKRLPIGVYGDGVRSIADLASAAVDRAALLPPWRREPAPELDALAISELHRQRYSSAAVPAAGVFVSFRRIETTAWGGVDEDIIDQIHPENVRIAEAAARVAGLAVAGIDMISADITRPWHENHAVINEVNYAPLLGSTAFWCKK